MDRGEGNEGWRDACLEIEEGEGEENWVPKMRMGMEKRYCIAILSAALYRRK